MVNIQLSKFLASVKGDVFKLLPMREDADKGVENHIKQFMQSLLINLDGALVTYPELKNEKLYLYVINNIQYIASNEVEFRQWRRIILNSTRNIENLAAAFGG